jgi:hypothetical protein
MLSRNSISSMLSAFLATALAYSLMAKVNVYLEDHYVEFINPGTLVTACMYTALFVPLHYIIEPTCAHKFITYWPSSNEPYQSCLSRSRKCIMLLIYNGWPDLFCYEV